MSFYTWLKKQCHRDDPVGDLARDVAADPDWPRIQGMRLKGYREYLESMVACDGAIRALERAHKEYEHIKKLNERGEQNER